MKTNCPLLPRLFGILLTLFWGGLFTESVHAEAANRYDALGGVLQPIASLFSPQSPKRGLSGKLVLESATGLPEELAGQSVEFAIQPPHRALVRFLFQGEPVTICRVGERLWITPGAKAEALYNAALASLPPPKKKKKKKKEGIEPALAPLVLPFSPQQLAFLPVLFMVEEGGRAEGLRHLQVKLMPELAKSLKVEEWTADVAVNEAGALSRLEVFKPGWKAAVRVEDLLFAKALPKETWEPTSEEVFWVSGEMAHRWVDALTRSGVLP